MTSSSYMLERELLGASKAIIDANSNTTLTQPAQLNTFRTSYTLSNQSPYVTTSTCLYHHGHTNCATDGYESRKALTDLQDEIRILKKDLEKKDTLIQELTCMKDANRHVHFEPDRYAILVGQDRLSLEAARRELEQSRIKIDTLNHDLREANIKLSAKDERVNETKVEIDSIKREYDIALQTNNQLRLRIRELESNANTFDTTASKSTITIAVLQRDAKEKQDLILELQARLRTYMEEREANERKMESLQRKLNEMVTQLGVIFGTEQSLLCASSFDRIVVRISDINGENISLKGQLVKLQESNKLLESEAQSNRATIQQMTNQLQSYESRTISCHTQVDIIRAERDAARNDKEIIKRELETTQTRLDSIQKAWQNARVELEKRESTFSTNELHAKQLENDVLYVKSCFQGFKEQIAHLLSDGYVKVEAKEDEIKEKIQLLMNSSKDRGIIITNLQNQKEQLSKQIQEQIDMNKEVDRKRSHFESHVLELEQRVKMLDNNYASTEAFREHLKQEKGKFLHFIDRLALIMKIERSTNQLTHELNPDILLARAEQLIKLEEDIHSEQHSTISGLQRRIKQLKEQLENKDVHLDLLRKKVLALEQGQTNKTDLEREIDDHVALSRKMKIKVETLTRQVNELKAENVQIKAQHTDVHTLQARLSEREKDNCRLLEDISKLEAIRDRQAVKIANLQERIHSVDDNASQKLISTENDVRTLANELRFLKTAFQQVTERERQLLDFHALVARMVGLDTKTLAAPDYEIIARLERLLSVAQPAVFVPTTQVPASTIRPAFVNQQPPAPRPVLHTHQIYHHKHRPQQTAPRSAHPRRRSPSPVPRNKDTNHRARSLSPLQIGIDPRTY